MHVGTLRFFGCTDHRAPKDDPTDRVSSHQASPMASLSHSNEAGLLGRDAGPDKSPIRCPRPAHVGSSGD